MKNVQSTIIQQLLTQFPKAASMTLARMAYRDNKEVFRNAEHARDIIRYQRGARGEANAKHIGKRELRATGDPFKLPKAIKQLGAWSPYVIPGPANILVLPDIHIPYHSEEALELAMQHGEKEKVDTLLLNGDTLDFFSISSWQTDPRERCLGEEIEAGRQFFKHLRHRFPKAKIIFKLGNHEERWERYLVVKAPELLEISSFRMEQVLSHEGKGSIVEDMGVDIVRDMKIIRAGKLSIIHGHEYRFSISNPVNPARGFFLRAKDHVLGSHLHQGSHHPATTIEGKVISAWSTGCLCDLHPRYRPLNDWSLGFACVRVERGGVFEVSNKKIIDGRIYGS